MATMDRQVVNGVEYEIMDAKSRDGVVNAVGLITDAIGNNTIMRRTIQRVVTYRGTWAGQDEAFAIPDGAKYLYTKWDSASAESGTLPDNKFQIVFFDEDDEQISYVYVNSNGARTNIPSGAVKAIVRTYTNNGTASNAWVQYSNLMIIVNSTDLETYIKDSVVLSELEEVKKSLVPSKNLLDKYAFKRGVINTNTGIYGPTPQNHSNTATEDLIPVEENTQYVWSWDWNKYYLSGYLFEYTEDGTYTGRTTLDAYMRRVRYVTFKTAATTKYIRLMVYSETATDYDTQMVMKHPQLEMGGIPSNYQTTVDISETVDYEKVKDKNFVLPDYYFADGYLHDKTEAIKELIYNAEGEYDAFFFITDTHWEDNQQKSIGLIRYLKRALNINKLFHGGDMYSTWSAGFHDEMLKELENAFGSFPYCVTGNHEYLNQMTDAQVWYYLNSLHRDIVPGNKSRNYYYVNDNVTKTRYVVLNVYGDNDSAAVVQFETEQVNWFRDVALNVEEGWKIVIFTHADYNISGEQRALFPIENVTSVIENVVDNYAGNGEIVCIIQGHTHIDRITWTAGGVPIIITTCDKNGRWVDPNTGIGDLDYVTRTSGTIAEQAFDVFVIDYKNRIISAVRIGSQAFNGTGNNIGTQVEIRQIPFNE